MKRLCHSSCVYGVCFTDSYAHRARVRAAVAADPQWQEQFISKVLPMLVSQEVEAVYLVPWSEIQKPAKKGMQTVASKLGMFLITGARTSNYFSQCGSLAEQISG